MGSDRIGKAIGEDDEQSTVSRIVDTLSDNVMMLVIAILASLVLSLLVIRMRQNRPSKLPATPPPPQSFTQNMPQYRYEQPQQKYSNVASAPDLSMFESKWK